VTERTARLEFCVLLQKLRRHASGFLRHRIFDSDGARRIVALKALEKAGSSLRRA
jgi:hypothetical protein